ncbi:hypothetical protein CsatA_026520 [Cannabis sativa]
MIVLRGTGTTESMLNLVIAESINLSNKLSFRQIGRITMIILGSGKVNKELCVKIISKLNSEEMCKWKGFFEVLGNVRGLIESTAVQAWEMSVFLRSEEALNSTFEANWRTVNDYISPIVQEFLSNRTDALQWIRKSTTAVMEHYSVFVTRLVVLTCLLSINFGSCTDLLIDVLRKSYITEQLPHTFCVILQRLRTNNSEALNVKLIAKALKKIDNPMVIVTLWRKCPFISSCSDAACVSMSSDPPNDEILRTLFPDKDEGSMSSAAVEASFEVDLPSSEACGGSIATTEGASSSSQNEMGSKRSKKNQKGKSGRKKK